MFIWHKPSMFIKQSQIFNLNTKQKRKHKLNVKLHFSKMPEMKQS